jgi:aryl-alcohol dehydrogenase-like predicted oxidoreductase
MKSRLLGQTGLRVAEIGLGAWQLGNSLWGGASEGQALRIVDAALDAGCNFFDSAPGYAEGRSEALLGQALLGRRDKAVLCSKFGHSAGGLADFSPAMLRPSVEASLGRLRTDFLDVLLLHNPPAELLDEGKASEIYAELSAMQAEGKIRAFGASVDWGCELRTLCNSTRSKAAEVLFNVFHQEPRTAFADAAARGVGIIVKVPLDSGWLSGKYNEASKFEGIRNRWPRDVIERRAGLVGRVRGLVPYNLSLAQAALSFVLMHPEVSTVIPGAVDETQVRANVEAAAVRLPDETFEALRRLWLTDLQRSPLPW